MTQQEKFIEASKRERFVLTDGILPALKGTYEEWVQHLTDIFEYDVYDCLLQKYKDGKILKRYIIELKIRDAHYGEMLLESKKLKDLKAKVYDDITDIIYINVTPEGTYVWNITNMLKDGIASGKLMCPKSTMGDKTKVNKGSLFLPIEKAKRIDYYFSEIKYKQSVNIIVNNDRYVATSKMYDYLFGTK